MQWVVPQFECFVQNKLSSDSEVNCDTAEDTKSGFSRARPARHTSAVRRTSWVPPPAGPDPSCSPAPDRGVTAPDAVREILRAFKARYHPAARARHPGSHRHALPKPGTTTERFELKARLRAGLRPESPRVPGEHPGWSQATVNVVPPPILRILQPTIFFLIKGRAAYVEVISIQVQVAPILC